MSKIIISESQPSSEWGLERLAEFVRKAGASTGELEVEAGKLGTTILRLHFDRGKALVIVRDEVLGKKRQAWARFRKENGFEGSTIDGDIRLYSLAYSWDEISGMGLTEARIYLGITKPKFRKEPVATTTKAEVAATTKAEPVATKAEPVATKAPRKEDRRKEEFLRRLEDECGDTLAVCQVTALTARLIEVMSAQEEQDGLEVVQLAMQEYWIRHGDADLLGVAS